MRDRKRRWIAAVSLAALFLSGCASVKSVQPLSNEETSTIDKRLIGAWEAADRQKEGTTGIFWVGKKRGSQNALEWVAVGLMKDLAVETVRATMFVRHRQANYLSLDLASVEKGEAGPHWYFCKYDIPDDKTVNVYLPKNETFREAVRKGELKGKLLKARLQQVGDGVVLEDSPETILRFLDQQKGKCFDDTPNVYKRVRVLGEPEAARSIDH